MNKEIKQNEMIKYSKFHFKSIIICNTLEYRKDAIEIEKHIRNNRKYLRTFHKEDKIEIT